MVLLKGCGSMKLAGWHSNVLIFVFFFYYYILSYAFELRDYIYHGQAYQRDVKVFPTCSFYFKHIFRTCFSNVTILNSMNTYPHTHTMVGQINVVRVPHDLIDVKNFQTCSFFLKTYFTKLVFLL